MEAVLIIILCVFFIALMVLGVGAVLWVEWIGATWLVEQVLNVHDGYSMPLKFLAFLVISGLISQIRLGGAISRAVVAKESK